VTHGKLKLVGSARLFHPAQFQIQLKGEQAPLVGSRRLQPSQLKQPPSVQRNQQLITLVSPSVSFFFPPTTPLKVFLILYIILRFHLLT
jgi:hypothetical protein